MYHLTFNSRLVFLGSIVLLTMVPHKSYGQGPSRPADFELRNPIFSNSEFIEARTPVFDDTIQTNPTFTWKVTGQRFVFLGIFSENIIVKDNSIINTSANVWSWHSGLGAGREGNVKFSDGVDVKDGKLQEGKPATSLKSGQSYVWAIWAWDNLGTRITHSSQEMFFTNESIPPPTAPSNLGIGVYKN